MYTQGLVNRLKILRDLLLCHPNYELCFLSKEYFKENYMQVVTWVDAMSICWLDGEKSALHQDITHVNGLTRFYMDMWDKTPESVKSRSAALKKLDKWLRIAKSLGYS